MLCKKLFIGRTGIPHGCGQCLPCRIKSRRVWTHRILLESLAHKDNAYVTLTYDEENCPDGGSLQTEDVQLFLKRLRKALTFKIRYFGVGEYGEQSGRPHYHLALFGFPTCFHGRTDHRLSYCCPSCETIKKAWSLGGVDLRGLGRESAAYIAGYVTKKWTNPNDPWVQERLQGRRPEKPFMSRRPGVGASSVHVLADFVWSDIGSEDLLRSGDVPFILKHGSKSLPLGRYLRDRLRKVSGLDDEKIKKENIKKFQEQMSRLLEDSFVDKKNRSKSLKKLLQEKNRQQILNLETRFNIKNKKGVL